MASRFQSSSLHQRDSRSDLFKGYTGGGSGSDSSSRRPVSASPNRYSSTYNSYQPQPSNGTVTAAPYYNSPQHHLGVSGGGGGGGPSNFRPATPNSRGQYSDAVLNELESQNDAQVDGILGKVRILKDMTVAIGDEIRESSALAEKMNEGFDRTRLRLRGTMNRMLLMAERTGVGWRVWLGFFAAVVLIFMYVWLF